VSITEPEFRFLRDFRVLGFSKIPRYSIAIPTDSLFPSYTAQLASKPPGIRKDGHAVSRLSSKGILRATRESPPHVGFDYAVEEMDSFGRRVWLEADLHR